MTKLSIIIPVYNVEKYLDKCLSSVINQTLREIEIILVDDQSPDNCPQMCDEYARRDSRIKVVHKENGGLGFARNSGLEIASGEYVTFLDSDDFIDLHTYEHLYNLASNNALDALYYKFRRFTDEAEAVPSEPIDKITLYKDDAVKELMLDIIASEPSAKADHRIQCSACTAVYRMAIIQEHNVRFHSERELISEDVIFNLDYLKYAKSAAYNDGEYYHYRVNPASLSSTFRTDRMEKNLILYEYIKENISSWNLNRNLAEERNNRLFIGNSRTTITHTLQSDKTLTEKKEWFGLKCEMPIWRELAQKFSWKKLPLYPRLFFFGCITKNYYLVSLLYSVKRLYNKYEKRIK